MSEEHTQQISDDDYSLVSFEEERKDIEGTTTSHHGLREHDLLLPKALATECQTLRVPTMASKSPSHGTNQTQHYYPETITPAYQRQRYDERRQVFACSLAALSGFADVLCDHNFGCYGSMMTGDTIRFMDHVAAGRWSDAVYPAALVTAYIIGTSLCTLLNQIDLTVLGLGGPSQEAFHTWLRQEDFDRLNRFPSCAF